MAGLNLLNDRKIKAASAGKLNDGGGLWLRLTGPGRGFWLYRYTIGARRPELGLGAYPETSLAEARREAEKWRAVRREGKDPQKVKEQEKRAVAHAAPSFAAMVQETFEAIRPSLKGDGVNGRWLSPLNVHMIPKIGSLPVDQINQGDIVRALRPIWREKTEAAKKALNRTGMVLKHAYAAGWGADLQAVPSAKVLLGDQGHVVRHIPAMPWQELPAFYESLNQGTIGERALKFLILTGLRSKPVRHLSLDHFDQDGGLTIPAELMKNRKGKGEPFRVALSDEARAVIDEAKPFSREGLLFPGARNKPISDRTLEKIMDRRGIHYRPHGFRSSFADWAAETTNTPRDVREAALAHATGGAVETSYKRTDFLEQRQALMQRWANHVTGKQGSVVQLYGCATTSPK